VKEFIREANPSSAGLFPPAWDDGPLPVAVHGYHRGIEDMAVYLPAIKKLLTPACIPMMQRSFCCTYA